MLRCSHSAVATFAARIGRAISFFPPSVHSVVTRGSLCPPNPSRFRLRSIVLNWGQPPLIVRLACGSRGRRSVTVFACYVMFFCSRPYSEVWQHSLLSCLNSLSSHILSTQRRACLHSLHSVTPIPLRYIKLHSIHSFDKPSSDPAKKTTLHAKTSPVLLWLSPHSLRYATFRALCQPPSLHSQRLRLTLRRQGKHSAIAPLLSHRLVAQGCFPLRWGKRCSNPEPK